MFTDVTTEDELKQRYRELAKKYHPDKYGGDAEQMKRINAEYDELLSKILNGHDLFGENLNDRMKLEAELRKKVELMSGLVDVILEICGCWLWITGDTKPYKTFLKINGMRWAHKKKAWYFHTGPYRKHSKKNYSLDDIRFLHGSTTLNKTFSHGINYK